MTVQEVDEFFEHFGVKGMQWGVRRSDGSSKQSMSTKKKVVIGAAAGTALVGIAATAVVLKSKGNLPVSSISKGTSSAAKTASRGKQAVDHGAWKTQVREFEAMLKADNNELYKHMVSDAARVGVPTISREEFYAIR